MDAQATLNLLQESYHSLKEYLASLHVSSDTLMAVYTGLALGVGVVVFLLWFPGDPEDECKPCAQDLTLRETEDSNQDSTEQSSSSSSSQMSRKGEERPLQFDVNKTVSKIKPLSGLLGISEDQLREAIEQTNEDLRNPSVRQEAEEEPSMPSVNPRRKKRRPFDGDDEPISFVRVLDWFFFLLLIGGSIVAMNYQYENVVTNMFLSFFPKEAEVLGLSFKEKSM